MSDHPQTAAGGENPDYYDDSSDVPAPLRIGHRPPPSPQSQGHSQPQNQDDEVPLALRVGHRPPQQPQQAHQGQQSHAHEVNSSPLHQGHPQQEFYAPPPLSPPAGGLHAFNQQASAPNQQTHASNQQTIQQHASPPVSSPPVPGKFHASNQSTPQEYYPPPSSPPHAASSHTTNTQAHSNEKADQEYFPPPPPGPPPGPPPSSVNAAAVAPNQTNEYHPNPLEIHPYMSGGAGSADGNTSPTETLPGYTLVAPGAEFTATGDVKQPMPPRPGSGHEQTSDTGAHAGYEEEALPSYTPAPAGMHFPGDNKPPALPPRPGSSYSNLQTPGTNHHNTSVTGLAPPPGGTSYSSGTIDNGPTEGDGKKKKWKGFGDKFHDWSTKAGAPINKLTNKLGSEAFLPTSMDKECDKAARILKSFCKTGVETKASKSDNHASPSPGHPTSPGPRTSGKTLVKIPEKAIKQAKGLVIFTVFRTGFHISGAYGSGIVLSRLPDGTWSPPSGFSTSTLGAGFMAGIDIYDCICVLNTHDAVDAFKKPRLSLGAEVAVVAGPVGAGTSVDAALGKGAKPVWSYVKSRGLFAGIQADGTIIMERQDANAAFYGEKKIGVDKILRGEVSHADTRAEMGKDGLVMWPQGAHQLTQMLRALDGDPNVDPSFMDKVQSETAGDIKTEGSGKDEGKARYM